MVAGSESATMWLRVQDASEVESPAGTGGRLGIDMTVGTNLLVRDSGAGAQPGDERLQAGALLHYSAFWMRKQFFVRRMKKHIYYKSKNLMYVPFHP